MKIIFYSTHCPKCRMLEMKLKQKSIVYEECNDVSEMLSLGLHSAPGLSVDGKVMDFKESVNWVNGR